MGCPVITKWKLRVLNLPYKLGGAIGFDFNRTVLQKELGTDINQCVEYSPASPAVKKVLRQLTINENDCILDIGCGKGKAISYMMSFPFQKIDGIEISEKLVKIAEKNFSMLKQRHRIHLYVCDARHFEDFDSYNYLFFYNPFSRDTMGQVKRHILESLKRLPREMVIIYENPVDRDLFETGEFTWKEYVYDICASSIVVYKYICDKNKREEK